MPRHATLSAMTSKPHARINSTVGRLQRQPPAKRRHGSNRWSWQAARNLELARTCSMNSSCPSGRSTRAISRSARSGSSTVQRTSVETTVSTDASASGRRFGRRVDDLGDARMPLHATCKSPAHRRFGLGEHELGEPVGIVRDIEPCAGADLDDVADGAVQKRASAAAHAGELTQPEKRVVHEREDPQPRRGRPARLELGACCLRHPANVRAAAPCRHRSTRPSPADGRFRLCHRSPRRAASATAAVRERRPSLRRMFATCR